MILAAIFCLFAVIAIIRLSSFACFTAREHNKAGAAMLWSFAAVIFICLILAVIRLKSCAFDINVI